MFSSFSRSELGELPARADLLIQQPEAFQYVLGEVKSGVLSFHSPEERRVTIGRLMGCQLEIRKPPRIRGTLYAPDPRYHSLEQDGMVFESANQTSEDMKRHL